MSEILAGFGTVFDWCTSYVHVVVQLLCTITAAANANYLEVYTQTDKYIYLCNPIHLVVYLYV